MANTYLTGNPIGSAAVKDLFDNASNLDDLLLGPSPSYPDRLLKRRQSWAGLEKQVNDFLESMGFEATHLQYVDGTPLTVLRPTQLIDRAGSVYKVKAPATFPVSLTGTWATDQLLLVDVGDISLRAALAAAPGAGLVGFDRSQTYPVATVGYELLRSLPAFVSARSFGFVGNGTNADTLKLQDAIDSGWPIDLGAGTFEVTLAQNITLEGGASVCALVIKSGMVIKGAGKGRTTIKLKDNESTDASPKYFNIFSGNTVISDAHFSDFTIDVNGVNNKISPNRGVGVYNPFNCAGIFVSGRVATVGVDARMLNCSITRIAVNNSPGVTCIATGQQEGSAVMSDNVKITFCDFYNNGIDSSDHSSIYMWGNKIWVENCNFDHPTPSTGVAGPVVAAELHGSSNFFRNNNINNYAQMVWVSGNQTGPSIGMHVTGNHARVTWVGVGLYSLTPIDLGLRDVVIADNTIEIWPAVITNPGMTFPKTGILLNIEDGQSDRVSVTGNVLKNSDSASNIGIFVGSGASAFTQDTLIADNLISSFARGIAQGLGALGTSFDTVIQGNTICNLTPATGVPSPDGIHISGQHGPLTIRGNKISGAAFNRGIFIGSFGGPATLDSLDMDGNDVAANATSAIVDNMVVSGRRQGRQACTFTVFPPTQATWKIGDQAFAAPNLIFEDGPALTKYITGSLRRMTNGTANVTGTDWLPERTLTGN